MNTSMFILDKSQVWAITCLAIKSSSNGQNIKQSLGTSEFQKRLDTSFLPYLTFLIRNVNLDSKL
jgi:hypothetical protein